MSGKIGDWQFVVIWEFQVRPNQTRAFEQAYGPCGDWAQFFSADQAYIGTELIRNLKSPNSYLTLDFWQSQTSYEAFRTRRAADYGAIDAKCEKMTEKEREVGRFTRVVTD